jgi:hypothetical protein
MIDKIQKHRKDVTLALHSALTHAFLGDEMPVPWSENIMILAIRCSKQKRRIDTSNLIGGLKITEDVVVKAGVVPDDGPKYVDWGPVQDRIESMWAGLYGPATHLFICRYDGTSGHANKVMRFVLQIMAGHGEEKS